MGPGDTLWLEVELARVGTGGQGPGALLGGADGTPPAVASCSSSSLARRSVGSPRPARALGVAGAVIVFVGIALLFAFEQPPFVAPDETAHVGYAHEIAGFDLPEVTKFPDVPDGAVQWQAEHDSGATIATAPCGWPTTRR